MGVLSQDACGSQRLEGLEGAGHGWWSGADDAMARESGGRCAVMGPLTWAVGGREPAGGGLRAHRCVAARRREPPGPRRRRAGDLPRCTGAAHGDRLRAGRGMVLTMRRCVEPQYGQCRPVFFSCGSGLASVVGGTTAALASNSVGMPTPSARLACASFALPPRFPTIP